ncbi:MAG: hypothetical protein Kow0062_07970 [Acidobacteriota bacterium]|nr:MAG: polymer-forming cytoskeletal protein [Acidobacteriota bacterium]
MTRRPPRDAASLSAWLGDEARLEGGTLRFDGTLRIDGSIADGTLVGPMLVIGEGAKITGRLEVERLEVYGRFDGEAQVDESVVVAPGGTFGGTLTLGRPALSVAEGGEFRGRVKMATPAPAASAG